jgi:hypothetical protein
MAVAVVWISTPEARRRLWQGLQILRACAVRGEAARQERGQGVTHPASDASSPAGFEARSPLASKPGTASSASTSPSANLGSEARSVTAMSLKGGADLLTLPHPPPQAPYPPHRCARHLVAEPPGPRWRRQARASCRGHWLGMTEGPGLLVAGIDFPAFRPAADPEAATGLIDPSRAPSAARCVC